MMLATFVAGYALGTYYVPPQPMSFLPRGITRLPFRLQPMPRPVDTPNTPPPPLDLILKLPPPIMPIAPEVQPRIVHYVYGLDNSTSHTYFPYFRYLAVRSALLTLQPTATFFHYHTMPTGPWWDLLVPFLTLSHVPDITSIFDPPRPVKHFAHKADVIRLQVLLSMGGTYLDVDTFILRDFGALGLREMDVVMGMEASADPSRGEWEPKGLCNAIIMSKRASPFLRRWWDSYRTFSHEQWATHSVKKPWVRFFFQGHYLGLSLLGQLTQSAMCRSCRGIIPMKSLSSPIRRCSGRCGQRSTSKWCMFTTITTFSKLAR